MALLLVVEPESRTVERVREQVLMEPGWSLAEALDTSKALQLAAARSPDLVIVNVDLDGAELLLSTFGRHAGGKGVLCLVPERRRAELDFFRHRSDGALVKPFTDQELRNALRGLLGAAKPPAATADHKLTSAEIFGDLLAEFDRDTASPPRPAARPTDEVVARKLEETLSGVIGLPKRPPTPAVPLPIPVATPVPIAAPAPPPVPVRPPTVPPRRPKADDVGVEELMSRLDVGGLRARPSPPIPRPSPPPARAPEPVPPPSRPVAAFDWPAPVAEPPPSTLDLPVPPPAAPPISVEVPFSTQRLSLSDLEEARVEGIPFGQYTLLEKIAVGGMAEVWKARMRGVEGFQKTVAIKKILPHLTDNSAFVAMFIDEAKLAAQLTHPNITHIFDLGKIGSDYYIAMEYVEGRNLRALLNTARRTGQRMSVGLALLVGARLASALDSAHRKKGFDGRELGLVHRDVSPQNVLLSNDGEVKLCDFGIVKAVAKASHTQMGALKGKLQYMSPEQAWGRPLDGRSDLFSLGAILFEMIVGRRLFPGDNEMAVLETVRAGRVAALADVRPETPIEVSELVARALAREPADRFQSAGEMLAAIEKLLYDLKPTPTQADLARWIRTLAEAPLLPESELREDEGSQVALHWPAPSPEEFAPAPALATTMPLPVAKPVREEVRSAEPPAPAPPPTQEVAAVRPPEGYPVEIEEGGGRGRTWLLAAILALVALGAVGWFVLQKKPAKTAEVPSAEGEVAPEAAVPEAVPQTEPPGSDGATDLQTATDEAAPNTEVASNDVVSLVDQELAKREQELRKRLEAEQKKLEEKVAQQKAAEEQRKLEEQRVEAERVATAEAETRAAAQAEEERQAREREEEARLEREREEARRQQEEQAAPTPVVETVKVGQLVRLGPGVTPPALVSYAKPEYPAVARRLRVEGVVEAEVLVDENGAVENVRLVSPIKQDVGINEAALSAARTAKFRPATKDGVRVKVWTRLKIPFKL